MTGRCACGTREAWRVRVRYGNYSAFSGYHRTYSDYSEVACEREAGGCGVVWRTKANYVAVLLDSEWWGEAFIQDRPTGERGHKGPTTALQPAIPESSRPRLVCEACGEPGGPLRGPLTPSSLGRGRVYHRDLAECRPGG